MPAAVARAVLAALAASGAAASSGLGPLLGKGHGNQSHGHNSELFFGGSALERTFTVYTGLPIGAAQLKKAGWTKHNAECDPHFGFAWTEDKSGATQKKPVKLYTTAAGQPSGVGVIMLSQDKSPLPESQFQWATAKPLVSPAPGTGVQHIDVAFRTGDIICNGQTSGSDIGDVLIVNPAGNPRELPLTEDKVKSEGWHRGSCFDGMGWHYFLDTAHTPPQMSHKAENLFPVVTMFNEGNINAIFFASWNNQVSIPIIASNEWEPKALSDSEMCANDCAADCHFAHTNAWSTLHIYFRDHKEVTCPSTLKCGLTFPFRGNCCEASTVVV